MYKQYALMTCFALCAMFCSGFYGCADDFPVESPPGYALDKPKKFILSESLREISGIVLLGGNPDTIYAIQDEEGKLYYYTPGNGKYANLKFGKRGDYEDVTILEGRDFVVLRSDGSLFEFPVSEVRQGNIATVRAYEHILPAGEYEGLFGDDNGRLIALCKNCPGDDQKVAVSGYELRRNAQGMLAVTNNFSVDLSSLELKQTNRRVKFRPSCLARHPLTREWYMVSSVNRLLLVLDDKWQVRSSYALDPRWFKQPEGIAFDRQGNMFISNEGGKGNGNLLRFEYRQPK